MGGLNIIPLILKHNRAEILRKFLASSKRRSYLFTSLYAGLNNFPRFHQYQNLIQLNRMKE